MTSLAKCLSKANRFVSPEDKALVKDIYKDYLDDGMKASEAAEAAVRDLIEQALGDRADIRGKIEKAGGAIDPHALEATPEAAVEPEEAPAAPTPPETPPAAPEQPAEDEGDFQLKKPIGMFPDLEDFAPASPIAPPFFSAALVAAQNLKQAKGSGDQLMSMLKKTPGVRIEELDWMDIEGFLAGRKGVTKDELVDYINSQRVEILDDFRGEPKGGQVVAGPPVEEGSDAAKLSERMEGNTLRMQNSKGDMVRDVLSEMRASKVENTALQDAVIGEEEDKAEVYEFPDGSFAVLHTFGWRVQGPVEVVSETDFPTQDAQWESYVLSGPSENYRALLMKLPVTGGAVIPPYKSSHFRGSENMFVHVRFDEREAGSEGGGGKVLHINEIQSDWHQEARKDRGRAIKNEMMTSGIDEAEARKRNPIENFYEKPNSKARRDAEKKRDVAFELFRAYDNFGHPTEHDAANALGLWRSLNDGGMLEQLTQDPDRNNRGELMLGRVPDGLTAKEAGKVIEYMEVRDVLRPSGSGLVPDAPFKKNWHEVAFRRMLRYAAEHDFDYISWAGSPEQVQETEQWGEFGEAEPTSEQLSSWVDMEVETGLEEYDIIKHDDEEGGWGWELYGEVAASVDDVHRFPTRDAAVEELTDLLRYNAENMSISELQERWGIDEEAGEPDRYIVAGQDVTPIVERYTQVLPRYANKFLKKQGARVETLDIDGGYGDVHEVNAVEITDEMRHSAVTHGYPMFNIKTEAELRRQPFQQEGESPQALTEEFAKAWDDGNVDTVLEEARRILPKEIQVLMQQSDRWHGRYVSDMMSIYLSTIDPKTFRHEVIHALKDIGVFSDPEWNALMEKAEAENWLEKHGVDIEEYTKIFEARGLDPIAVRLKLLEEAIAEEFSSRYGEKMSADLVGKLLARLKRYIEALQNGFKGLGFADAESVFQKIDEGAYAGTDTPAFKRWFGDSKVVDENGEPLVVYHGTGRDFEAFDFERLGEVSYGRARTLGPYFTASPQVADKFAGKAYPFTNVDEQWAPNTVPAYLSLQNPLVMQANDFWQKIEHRWGPMEGPDRMGQVRQRLMEGGYDGLIIEADPVELAQGVDRYGGPGEFSAATYIPFNPTQIKSVNNRGTWDPSDPNISYSLRSMRDELVSGYMAPTEVERDALMGRSLGVLDRRALEFGKWANAKTHSFHDSFNDWRRLIAQNQRDFSMPDADMANPGRKETLLAGKVAELYKDIMEDLYEPFMKAMHDARFTPQEFELYAYALHAQETNKYIKSIRPDMDDGSGMSLQDAKDTIADLEQKYSIKIARFNKSGDPIPEPGNEFEAFRKKYYVPMMDFALKHRLDRGLLNQESYDKIKSTYKYYTNLKGRDVNGEDWAKVENVLGYNIKSSGLKRRYGRASRARGMLAHAIYDMKEVIFRAEKNEIPLALYEHLLEARANDPARYKDFAKHVAEIDKTRWVKVIVEKGESIGRIIHVPKGVADRGADSIELWLKDPTQIYDTNVVHGMKDGKRFGIRIKDSRLLESFRSDMGNLDSNSLEKLLRISGGIVRHMTKTLTQWNPDFMLPNPVKDIQTAAFNLTGDQAKYVHRRIIRDASFLAPKLVRLEASRARNKTRRMKGRGQKPSTVDQTIQDWHDEARRAGAYTGIVEFLSGPDDVRLKLERELKQLAGEWTAVSRDKYNRVQYRDTMYNALNVVVQQVDEVFDPLNAGLENASRLAVYMYLRKEAGYTAEQAAEVSKNITTNFNRRGTNKWLSRLFMFAQPAINGNTSMFKMAFHSKEGRNLVKGAIGTMAALTLYNTIIGSIGSDDDEINLYEQIPDYERARYAIIMLPFEALGFDVPFVSRATAANGRAFSYLKIPLAWGFSFFTNIGRLATETMLGQTTDFYEQPLRLLARDKNPLGQGTVFREVFNDFLESFSPVGTHDNIWAAAMPTAIKPFFELFINQAFHGGSIAPPDPFNTNTNPSSRSKLTTPETYKWISETVNSVGGDDFSAGPLSIPPDWIKHLVNTYGGGTKRTIDGLLGFGEAAVSTVQGEPYDPELLRTHKWLVLRRFLGGDRGFAYQSHFYDFKNGEFAEFENARRTSKRDQEDPDLQDRALDKMESPDMAVASRMQGVMKDTEKRQRQLRADKKWLYKDPDVSAGEKSKRDRELRDLSQISYMRAVGELRWMRREVAVDQDSQMPDKERSGLLAEIAKGRSRLHARLDAAAESIEQRGGRGVVVEDARIKRLSENLGLVQ